MGSPSSGSDRPSSSRPIARQGSGDPTEEPTAAEKNPSLQPRSAPSRSATTDAEEGWPHGTDESRISGTGIAPQDAATALEKTPSRKGTASTSPPTQTGAPGASAPTYTGRFTRSGAPPASRTQPQLAPGDRLAGRYVVEALLGRGGFGEVYRVRDSRSGDEPVALKVHRLASGRSGALEAIKGEFSLLGSLQHPNLARVYDFGLVGGELAYFTQQLVTGRPFDQAAPPIDSPAGVRLVGQLCRALDYLHARGILHRDVKPSNVLVDAEREHLTLLDFGVARTLRALESELFAGTFPFMAPEAIFGDAVDARTDLYALGVTLYKLAAGRLPFTGPRHEVVRAHLFDSPPPLPDEVPAGVARVVRRLLSKEPSARYASAAETLAALADATGVSVSEETHETLTSYVLSAPWVGDEQKLERLADTAARAEAGARAVLVVGETGTGKSRLLREIRQRVQLVGRSWIALAGHRGGEGEGSFVHELATAVLDSEVVAQLGDADRVELARTLPQLRKRGEQIAIALDPERAHARRLDVLSKAASERFGWRPGVLAVEDLHWLADDELESLGVLLDAIRERGARCVPILSARPGDAAERAFDRLGAARVECLHLDAEQCERLAASTFGTTAILDGTDLGERLREGAHSALWVQESLRLALEKGAVVRGTGYWQRVAPVPAKPLQHVLRERIQCLSPAARTVAVAAAVLARAVSVGEIAATCGWSVRRTGPALRELVRTGIVEDTRDTRGRPVYAMHDRFVDAVHELTDDYALHTAHRRAGKWLTRRRDAGWRALARAADHLLAAGDDQAALDTLSRAASRAETEGRPDLAAPLVEREHELRRVRGERPIATLLRHHDLAAKGGLPEAADRSLDRLARRRRWASPRQRFDITLRLARSEARRGGATRARRLVRSALAQARRLELGRGEAQALRIGGEIELAHGRFERALKSYAASSDLAGRVGDRELEARALLGSALAALRTGRTEQARDAAGRAVRASKAARDRELESEALRHLGNAERERGEAAKALRIYARAVRAARESGSIESEGKALNNLASTAHWRGRIAETLEAHRRAIVLKERAGATSSALLTYSNMGALLTTLGRHEEARAALDKVLAASGNDAPVAVSLARSNKADLHVVRGDLEAALGDYRLADELYAHQEWAQLHTIALAGRVRTLLMRADGGDSDEVREKLAVLERLASELRIAEVQRRYHTTAAMVADAARDRTTALEHAREAARDRELLTAFSDVFGTSIEARWMLAVLHGRAGHTNTATREAHRARRMLARCARRLGAGEDRRLFLSGHPLYRAIRHRRLDPPPGCTWDPAAS